MKKKEIFILLIAFFVFVLTFVPISTGQYMVAASEAYQKTESSSGVITAAEVNLRTGPATSFDIICKLKKNQKVTVMGKLGDWYAVYVGGSGNVGSVSSRYLKLDKVKSSSSTKQAPSENKSSKTTGTKNNKTVTKTTASGNNAKIKSAVENSTVKTAGTQNINNISSEERHLFELVNNVRKEQGLSLLQLDGELVNIARLKAKDMKDNNYFSHTSKYYGTPYDMVKGYKVKFSTVGENIAGNLSGEKAINEWLKKNNNNIYNGKFTHTGIGIVDSPTYGKLFVQLFIKK